jgi:hypothetical protein
MRLALRRGKPEGYELLDWVQICNAKLEQRRVPRCLATENKGVLIRYICGDWDGVEVNRPFREAVETASVGGRDDK